MSPVQTRGRRSEHGTLSYNIEKGKTKLLECGILSNGGVGGNTELSDGEIISWLHCNVHKQF